MNLARRISRAPRSRAQISSEDAAENRRHSVLGLKCGVEGHPRASCPNHCRELGRRFATRSMVSAEVTSRTVRSRTDRISRPAWLVPQRIHCETLRSWSTWPSYACRSRLPGTAGYNSPLTP